MQDEPTIDAGNRKVRVDFGRPIEIGNRSIVATLFIPDQAAITVDMGVGEAESDSVVERKGLGQAVPGRKEERVCSNVARGG